MKELRSIAGDLGATDISTYIASGNLICTPPCRPDHFDRALETAIEQRYGFFREVISRSRDELVGASHHAAEHARHEREQEKHSDSHLPNSGASAPKAASAIPSPSESTSTVSKSPSPSEST